MSRRKFRPILTDITKEKREWVDSVDAADYMNRTIGTMASWAKTGNGPIQCTRVDGRVWWASADILAYKFKGKTF